MLQPTNAAALRRIHRRRRSTGLLHILYTNHCHWTWIPVSSRATLDRPTLGSRILRCNDDFIFGRPLQCARMAYHYRFPHRRHRLAHGRSSPRRCLRPAVRLSVSRCCWSFPRRSIDDELGCMQYSQLPHDTHGYRSAQFMCWSRADYCTVDMEEQRAKARFPDWQLRMCSLQLLCRCECDYASHLVRKDE
jgi:hypothetical protein